MDDRRLFLALAERGSFSATARDLDLARSTVMRRIDALEADLGVTLVQRAGRSIALTAAGQRLADGLRGVFRSLDRVEQEVRSLAGDPAGTVRLWLPLLGTSAFIATAVAEFSRNYPDIVVRLELGRDPRALRPGDFDVAMQIGHRINPELKALTLFRERMILVASPAYLEAAGEPVDEEDLPRHRAVEERDLNGRIVPWRRLDGSRVRAPKVAASANAIGLVHALVLGGAGIGRVPSLLAREDLASGRLRAVLPAIVSEDPVSLVYLPDPAPPTRAFLTFMAEHVERRRALAAEEVEVSGG